MIGLQKMMETDLAQLGSKFERKALIGKDNIGKIYSICGDE